tara:strand:+ start:115 stop:666 length:552 start_codon:yes stop_codon:yes gene_type:complete
MQITISQMSKAIAAKPLDSGLYDITAIARELRLDFYYNAEYCSFKWYEQESAGLKKLGELKLIERQVVGSLMAVYAYINWFNSHMSCVTKMFKVVADCDVQSTTKSAGDSIDFILARLEIVQELVFDKTNEAFLSNDAPPLKDEDKQVLQDSIHLNAALKSAIAVLNDQCYTWSFDEFHGLIQ